MAYPVITNSYGFTASQRLDGLPYAGVIRQVPIASGYATAIFNGDLVNVNASGQLQKSGVTTDSSAPANFISGVFLGCGYTNPSTLQFLQYNFYQGNVVAPDIVGNVIDDPFVAFKVAAVNAAGVVTAFGRSIVGANVAVNTTNAGNTLSGLSGLAIDGTTANTTATLPFRVIDVVQETGDGAGNFFEFIVKINTHQYNNSTGV